MKIVVRLAFLLTLLFAVVVSLRKPSSTDADTKPKRNIPASVLKAVSACNSTSEVFRRFVKRKSREDGVMESGSNIVGEDFIFRFDGSINPLAMIVIDNSEPIVECKPRVAVIKFPDDPDPNVIYEPPCTELSRCSGCCEDLLSCQATAIQTVYKVTSRLMYNERTGYFDFDGFVNVSMEDHTACECACEVKEENCDASIHDYDADACACRCKKTPDVCESPKEWSEEMCDCTCPSVSYCLEDQVYDFMTCSCAQRPEILPVPSNDNNGHDPKD